MYILLPVNSSCTFLKRNVPSRKHVYARVYCINTRSQFLCKKSRLIFVKDFFYGRRDIIWSLNVAKNSIRIIKTNAYNLQDMLVEFNIVMTVLQSLINNFCNFWLYFAKYLICPRVLWLYGAGKNRYRAIQNWTERTTAIL